ncbi:hypothetical protein EDC96DRAFT_519011 [Choanephora cucurbitarum]|nr:hypothetical protein EDC96DRAFT_519011 [Choanephora cucurbitarum]
MNIRRNFGRCKIGQPAKVELPNNRGVSVTIVRPICEKGIIDLTLRKSKAVQRRAVSNKKRKRKDGLSNEIVTTGKVGTRSEHFLEFIAGVMDTLDKHNMTGRYIVVDNAAIHKVSKA